MYQTHRPAWKSRGWMSFTVADTAAMHLGGASITTPTSVLCLANFLDAGIPQSADKSRFAEIPRGDTNGHAIKHAVIRLVSGGATSPAARTATNGSTPTTSAGQARDVGEVIELHNSRDEIFNFKLFNRSGGNMVVEVEVFE
jgi:hypothetical protein